MQGNSSSKTQGEYKGRGVPNLSFPNPGDYHRAIADFLRKARSGERLEEARGKKFTKMRVWLKAGENDSEELISHSSKEAHN